MFLLKLRFFGRSMPYGLLLLALLFNLSVFSQFNDRYELLWEIKHKDSDQKSYLFGTMHMADKRLFNFSDALLPAIMNTDAFALELHPNVILESLFDDFQKKDEQDNIYRRILSEEDYKRLDERFKKINGISIDDYPNLHYYLIETMIYPQPVREDDMITIVDSYLYGLAAMFDKEIYGLEGIENQLPSVEEVNETDEDGIRENIVKMLEISDEDYLEMMEEMIDIYAEGNISRLFNYMAEDTLDASMKFRNRVMTNSIKDIIANQTLFATVGAAHLPGESGIIRMLQNDGYEVKRVVSPFTGVSTQMELVPNIQKWYKEHNSELGFSVSTPTKPYSYTVDQSFEVFTTIDLVTNNYLMYFVIELTDVPDETEVQEALLDNFLNEYYELEVKDVIEIKTDDHWKGFRTLYFKEGENYKRIFAGISNGHLYSFFTENKRLSSLNSPFSEAFFNSIEIFTPVKRETQWVEIEDSWGAFTILFPENSFQNLSKEVPHPYETVAAPLKIYLYSTVDHDTKTNYLLRYFDQPRGFYLENESVVIEEFKEYYNEIGKLQNEPRKIEVNGLQVYEMEGFLINNSHFVSRVFFRGNRQYMLLAVKETPNERINKANTFFNSFSFNEYAGDGLSSTIKVGKKYSIAFPEKMSSITIDEIYEGTAFKTNTKYFGNNPYSGSTYVVDHIKLKPYFRIKNLEEFYKSFEEEYKEEGDELLISEPTLLSGFKAHKLVYKNVNSNVYQHFLMVLDNDNLFTFQVYNSGDEQEQMHVENFFNSFTKKSRRDHFDIYSSKAPQILKDLNSKNRSRYARARDAFNYYYFDADDLPAMEQFIARSYKDDEDYNGVKNTVIKELAHIPEPAAARVLKNLYINRKTTNTQKITILETLPKIEADVAFEYYTQLLFENPPQYGKGSPMVIFDGFHNYGRSLSNYLEPLSQLVEVPKYRNELMYLVNTVMKSDTLVFEKIREQPDVWLKHFKSDVETYLAETDFEHNPFFNVPLLYNYVEIIDTLKVSHPDISKGLNTIATAVEQQEWLKTKAVIAQFSLNLTPDAEVLAELMENKYTRFEIMEAMVNNNKQGEIPEKYLKAQAYSKLSLYNFIGLYTYYPEIISHLGEFTENNRTFHAFSFEVDEEPGVAYLAVVEAGQINFEDFKQFNVFFGGDKAGDNWLSTANTMVLEYSYFSE
jgi:uncharacterized protein YbaP (TraB family)